LAVVVVRLRVKLGVMVVRVVVLHTIIQPVPGRVCLDKVTRVVMRVTAHIEMAVVVVVPVVLVVMQVLIHNLVVLGV
tara:strand:- start:263 stop:493 length:231 start_codon:yes stop_codon:yes gene_type:complete